MIPRYSRPAMTAIWAQETKFRIWFEIEAHATDALADLGVVPRQAAETIWEKGGPAVFDVERIDEIERVTKHDVIAFLTHLAEIVGPDARFVHQGMTSSDVLDLLQHPARARDGPSARRHGRPARRHRAPRLRVQGHGLHRPQSTASTPSPSPSASRWPRPTPSSTAAGPASAMPARRSPPAPSPAPSATSPTSTRGSRACRREARSQARARLDPGHPARPARHVFRHARRDRLVGRAAFDRDPPPAAHEVLEAEEYFSPGQKGSSAMPHKRNRC